MRSTYVAFAVALFATAANSETLSMNGEGVGTADTSITEITKGHLVMITNSTYEGFAVDGNPMANSTGACNGTMEMMAGKLSGGGHCVYSDPDGDKWVVTWTPDAISEKGATVGHWTLTGGSGKYEGATGGGTFSSLTDQETRKFVNTTTGEVTLK